MTGWLCKPFEGRTGFKTNTSRHEIWVTDFENNLIRGARRNSSFSYPNQEWGYGELDLYGVFASLL